MLRDPQTKRKKYSHPNRGLHLRETRLPNWVWTMQSLYRDGGREVSEGHTGQPGVRMRGKELSADTQDSQGPFF